MSFITTHIRSHCCLQRFIHCHTALYNVILETRTWIRQLVKEKGRTDKRGNSQRRNIVEKERDLMELRKREKDGRR